MNINLHAQNPPIQEKELLLAIPQEFYFNNSTIKGALINYYITPSFLLEYTDDFSWLTTTAYVSAFGDYYGLYTKYEDQIFAQKEKDAYIPWETGGNRLAQTTVENIFYLNCSKYWKKANEAFDNPSFLLYKATIQYIELGQETLKVPNYQYKPICRKKAKDFYMHSYQVNAIINVLEVEPITQVEAEEWLSQ